MNTKRLLEWRADRIEAVLSVHKISARVTGGTVTPRWVRFQVLPAVGAKISKIKSLSEELAAALDVPNVRMSRRGAAVAVEIPRQDPQPVRLLPLYRQLAEDGATLQGSTIPAVTAVLGLAEDGAPLLIRLPSPDVAHILVAGTTGSGKTVLLRAMILSLALGNDPHTQSTNGRPPGVGLVLIDPRGGGSFGCFDGPAVPGGTPTSGQGLPHLVRPVVRNAAEAVEVLGSLVRLMEQRDWQRAAGGASGLGRDEPPVVVVIDELADLLQVSGAEAASRLTRLTQRGRNAGIHVVAATQKPTVAVLGSLVKANFPTRLVGRVTCAEDARTASGWSSTGAERLMGRGDFLAVAEGRVIRFQAAHVSEEEIAGVIHCGWTAPARVSWPAPGRVQVFDGGEPVEVEVPATQPWPANRLAEVFRGSADPQPLTAAMIESDRGPRPAILEPDQGPRPAGAGAIELPGPPEPEPSEVELMVERLQALGWNPGQSYRDACRTLGEAEGGRRFPLVQQAVDRLRTGAAAGATAGATASATASGATETHENDENGTSESGSGSTVALTWPEPVF